MSWGTWFWGVWQWVCLKGPDGQVECSAFLRRLSKIGSIWPWLCAALPPSIGRYPAKVPLWQIWLYLVFLGELDLRFLVKMLLSQWRKEFWQGINSWKKSCVQNCTIVLGIYWVFFAMCGKLPPHIQWILVFQKQENCNSEINYHTVLISKSNWATWDPKWPWKLQENLENSMFCS